jgi:F-type H+-transporting ATPase subunit delta
MTTREEQPQYRVTDVSAVRVARVYAEALLNAATERSQVDEVFAELGELIDNVLGTNAELWGFLESPVISRERKAEVIARTFKGKASDTLYRFLEVLNNHGRFELLRPIRAVYQELLIERRHQTPILVTSAVPLTDAQREKLLALLRQGMQREPLLREQVDPTLLGGVTIRSGDWLYDGSLRSRLENLRNQIIERGGYEIQSGRDRFSTD